TEVLDALAAMVHAVDTAPGPRCAADEKKCSRAPYRRPRMLTLAADTAGRFEFGGRVLQVVRRWEPLSV
ncbi:MAG TPA: hypothetical protein VF316_04110, partial [Polyangiaceae bacterium]